MAKIIMLCLVEDISEMRFGGNSSFQDLLVCVDSLAAASCKCW